MALTPNAPGAFDITVNQYSTYQCVFTFPPETDLSGYSASMNAVDNLGNVIVRLTTGNSDIVIDTGAATVTLNLSAAQTSTLPPGTYQYDSILINGATVNPLSFGAFIVVAGYTPN